MVLSQSTWSHRAPCQIIPPFEAQGLPLDNGGALVSSPIRSGLLASWQGPDQGLPTAKGAPQATPSAGVISMDASDELRWPCANRERELPWPAWPVSAIACPLNN